MKTRSIISILAVLILVIAAVLISKENKLLASTEMAPQFNGYVYQYGSCNNQTQAGAFYQIYNVTTSTSLKSDYTDSTGYFYCGGILAGHTIRVTASYGIRCRVEYFVQTGSGLTNLSVCLANCDQQD